MHDCRYRLLHGPGFNVELSIVDWFSVEVFRLVSVWAISHLMIILLQLHFIL